jgi:hypothetical protein
MSPEARGRAFDALATEMASGRLRRGKALKLMAAALVGSTLGSLGIGEAAADNRDCKRSVGARCKSGAECCSGNCKSGTCAPACAQNGSSCTSNLDCCSGNCFTDVTGVRSCVATMGIIVCRCEGGAGAGRCEAIDCSTVDAQARCETICAQRGLGPVVEARCDPTCTGS